MVCTEILKKKIFLNISRLLEWLIIYIFKYLINSVCNWSIVTSGELISENLYYYLFPKATW